MDLSSGLSSFTARITCQLHTILRDMAEPAGPIEVTDLCIASGAGTNKVVAMCTTLLRPSGSAGDSKPLI